MTPKKSTMCVYLIPSMVIYIFTFIVPVVLAIILSFFKFSSIKRFTFIGIENYITLINDPNFWLSLRNNIFLVVVCLIGQIGIAFLLACILSSSKIVFANLYRTVIYFPVTLSAVVIGYVWKFVYDYNYGLLAYLLKAVGKGDMVVPWLGQDSTVMICACIPLIWQYVGFHLVILLSAMTTIEKDIYEMAEIDGANGVQKARYITLPLVKPTLSICIILCISANMKVFDHIVSLTGGGPGYASNVLALYAYNISFSQMNMGYGSAISVGILICTALLFGISSLLQRVGKERY